MGDINFLSNNKGAKKRKVVSVNKGKQKIRWSDPAKEKVAAKTRFLKERSKGKSSGWFSYFKKWGKGRSSLKEKSDNKNVLANIDRERLKQSRQEILRFIKEEGKSNVASMQQGKEHKRQKHWLNFLTNKKSDKEVQADYRKERSEEKKEKKLGVKMTKNFKEEKKVKFAGQEMSAKDKKLPSVSLPDKSKKMSLLDKFKKHWHSITKRGHKDFIEDKPKISVKPQDKKKASKHKKEVDSKVLPSPREEHIGKIKEEKGKSVPQWSKPDIIETNLIKDELASFFNWRKGLLILSLNVIFALLIIAGSYKGLILWGEKKTERTKEFFRKIEELNEKIKPLEEDAKMIIALQKKIKVASDLVDKHIYWTNFFKFLEDNTVPDVYFFSFSGDNGGSYTFSAQASSFKAIADQVQILRSNEYVEQVKVSGGKVKVGSGEEESSVSFKLELSVNPSIFTQ
jgi:hypothetical protein